MTLAIFLSLKTRSHSRLGVNQFWSNSIVFHQYSIPSVIAMLTLARGVNGPIAFKAKKIVSTLWSLFTCWDFTCSCFSFSDSSTFFSQTPILEWTDILRGSCIETSNRSLLGSLVGDLNGWLTAGVLKFPAALPVVAWTYKSKVREVMFWANNNTKQ